MKLIKYGLSALLTSGICMADGTEVEPQQPSKLAEFWERCEKGLTIGNFTTFGRAKDSERELNGVKDETVGYSSLFADAFLSLPITERLSLYTAVHGHFQAYDLNNSYDNKYEEDEAIHLAQLHLDLRLWEESHLRAGRFNVRNIANHLDPQMGEGVYFEYNEGETWQLQLGAIQRFASFWNDSVTDYWRVDDAYYYNLPDAEVADDIGDTLFFAELNWKVTDNFTFDPYIYHQDNYVNWYGVDSNLFMEINNGFVGVKTKLYAVDALFDSEVDGLDDSTYAWAIKPYINIGHWEFDLGYAQFGDNGALNRPAWGYRYLNNILYDNIAGGSVEIIDYNSMYGASNSQIWFGRTLYEGNDWTAFTSLAFYETDENGIDDESVELQIGGTVKLPWDLNLGGRYVELFYDELPNNEPDRDARYVEMWISRSF